MAFAIFLGVHDAPLHGYLSEVGPKAETGQNVDVGVVAVGFVLGEPLGDEKGQPLESRPEMSAKMSYSVDELLTECTKCDMPCPRRDVLKSSCRRVHLHSLFNLFPIHCFAL